MSLVNRFDNHPRSVDPFGVLTDPYIVSPYSLVSRISDQLTSNEMRQSMRQFAPILSADLIESDTDFHIHTDLPGVDREDLDISFLEGQMTIKAERKEVHEVASDTVHKIERTFGKVQRTITIPKNADIDNCQASLKDGVLCIMFPKLETTQVRKITVA